MFMLRLKYIFVYAVFFTIPIIASIQYKEFADILEPSHHITYRLSCITYSTDPLGQKYLTKQIRFHDYFNSPFNTICEVLAVEIGMAINASINQIGLIPAGVQFIGKDIRFPATLHKYVPGIRFDTYQGSAYKGLYIKQKNLKNRISGLTRTVIYHMSRHKDLPVLVALDAFVGNADRGKSNYFYDEITDSFYGIDMAGTFYRDICGLSIEHIKSFLCEPKEYFSRRELQGLLLYYQTLRGLVLLYSPDYLCARLEYYIQRAGLQKKRDTDFFNLCRATIVSNHVHAVHLVELLARLLGEWHMLPSIG